MKINNVIIATRPVRADKLSIGDVIVTPWWDETTRIQVVVGTLLVGDDVDVTATGMSGSFTTSRSNMVEVVR